MVGLQILLNKRVDVKTLLKIPGSFLISSLVGIYNVILPAPAQLWSRAVCMALAILCNGVGGTVFAMIFVGRVMAVFNHSFRKTMMAKAGIPS